MSTNPSHRLDHRLETVHDSLSLAYQFLLALDYHNERGPADDPALDTAAVSVLTRLVREARENARVVGDALPSAIGVVEVPDDYADVSGRGLPLQPVLDAYRQRFGDDAFAEALNGRARDVQRPQGPPPRAKRSTPMASRRRKAA